MKVALCLVLGLAVCAPAFAQSAATGSIRPDSGPAVLEQGQGTTGDDLRLLVDSFAACLLRESPSEIMRALKLPDDTAIQEKALEPSNFSSCLVTSRTLTIDFRMLRAGFYKALFKRKFPGNPPALPTMPIDFAVVDGTLAGSTGATTQHGAALNLADCLIRANPSVARNLVLATAGSRQETRAVDVLTNATGGCSASGAKMSVDTATLVGLIAEAYYRDAVTPQKSGA